MLPLGLILLVAASDAAIHEEKVVVSVRPSHGLVSPYPARGIVPAWKGLLERDAATGRVHRHAATSHFGTRPDSTWLRRMRDSTGHRVVPNWIGTLQADGTAEPYFPDQWALSNTAQEYNGVAGTKGADVGALEAWGVTMGDSSIVVAFLDGGTDVTHPEFKGKLAHNKMEVQGVAGNDDDGNGFVDDTLGWDFVRGDGVARDLGGHGTSTASLMVGAWDGNGIAGLAPGVRLLPVRVADGGSRVELGDLIAGMDYAISRKAKIINLSLGGLPAPDEIDSAIMRAVKSGAVVVVSAGNEGLDLDVSPRYPAALRLPGLLVVGASGSRDELSWYSNHSEKLVDLSAPGDALVAATIPEADTIWTEDFESGLSGWTTGGTSAVTWGTETLMGSTWLSDSPGKLYTGSGRSWIRSPKLNSSGRSSLLLSLSLRGSVNASDYMMVESSSDSAFGKSIDTLLQNGYFTQDSAIDVTYDVGQDGVPFYLRFSMVSLKPSSTTDSGVQIDNLVLRARDLKQPANGTYARVWGTSFSAPLASAALALVASKHPDAPPESLVAAVVRGAEVVSSLATASRSSARLWVPGAFKQIEIATAVAPSLAGPVGGLVHRPGRFLVREQGAWTLEWRDLRGSLVGRESGSGESEVACRASSPVVWTLRSSGRNLSGFALVP